jgi:hypothetical protein
VGTAVEGTDVEGIGVEGTDVGAAVTPEVGGPLVDVGACARSAPSELPHATSASRAATARAPRRRERVIDGVR